MAFLVAALAAYLTGWGCRLLGPKLRMMDHPDGTLKPHETPIPFLGGIAVFVGMAIVIVSRPSWLDGPLRLVLPAALLLGLLDDRVGLSPVVRLIGQILLGGIMASVLPAVAFPWPWLEFVAAVILFVGIVNAVNMVDGMDGLSGSCAAITCAGLTVIGWPYQSTLLMLLAAGGILGFLVHNWPPARLYLGDNGAYLVGAVLTIAILTRGRTPEYLAGAVTALGIFALDLGLSILRRLFGGTSPFHGDRQHFYDQLVTRGFSKGRVLAICIAIQVAAVGVGYAISTVHISKLAAVIFVVFWALVAVALAVLGFVRPKEQPA